MSVSQSIFLYSKLLATRANSHPETPPAMVAKYGLHVNPQVLPAISPRRLIPNPIKAPNNGHKTSREVSTSRMNYSPLPLLLKSPA
jgi:hypothetical protein